MTLKDAKKRFFKKWAIITVTALTLFQFTKWNVWSAIIFSNATNFDVPLADGYTNFGHLIIIALISYIAIKQWKNLKLSYKPIDEYEIEIALKTVAEKNEQLLYDHFLAERLKDNQEKVFSAQHKESLQRIADYNNKVKVRRPEESLHPYLAKKIDEILKNQRN